jgi:two-component system, NarL family, nitrate/nitrite response regulator NarL
MASTILPVRIGIIDDHCIVREGFVRILRRLPGARVVFEGSTARDAVQLTTQHEPDMLIVDLGIEGGGLNAIMAIRESLPQVRCVVLTASDDPNMAIAALSLGAKGFILKGISASDLIAALQLILSDRSYVSPEFAMKLVSAAHDNSRRQVAETDLSVREIQVITEVEKGRTNRQIAEHLKLSEQTVKYYMTSLMQKFGVNNRTLAVLEYRKQRPN